MNKLAFCDRRWLYKLTNDAPGHSWKRRYVSASVQPNAAAMMARRHQHSHPLTRPRPLPQFVLLPDRLCYYRSNQSKDRAGLKYLPLDQASRYLSYHAL